MNRNEREKDICGERKFNGVVERGNKNKDILKIYMQEHQKRSLNYKKYK